MSRVYVKWCGCEYAFDGPRSYRKSCEKHKRRATLTIQILRELQRAGPLDHYRLAGRVIALGGRGIGTTLRQLVAKKLIAVSNGGWYSIAAGGVALIKALDASKEPDAARQEEGVRDVSLRPPDTPVLPRVGLHSTAGQDGSKSGVDRRATLREGGA